MSQQDERTSEWRRLEAAKVSTQRIAWEMHVDPRTVTRWRARWRQAHEVTPVGLPVVPERPAVLSDEEYALTARLLLKVYVAGMGASAQEGAEMGEMLGLPREVIAAAMRDMGEQPASSWQAGHAN